MSRQELQQQSLEAALGDVGLVTGFGFQALCHTRPSVAPFELCRRDLYEPEIITFDELLERAQWHLAVAESEVGSPS